MTFKYLNQSITKNFLIKQGYDDIPKEIPDADAKKVVFLDLVHVDYNYLYQKTLEVLWSSIKMVCNSSLMTGMTRKMVSGPPQLFQIPSTRVHGKQRFVNYNSSIIDNF